ncbi:MAG: hypothetical protein JWQ78_509 [Sediminibacterium sp.]|nr:hypothetical protein [Sediminibacterium sp.]
MKNRLLLTSSLLFIVVVGISFFKLDLTHPSLYKYIFIAGFALSILNGIFIIMSWKTHTVLTRIWSILLVIAYLVVFVIGFLNHVPVPQ